MIAGGLEGESAHLQQPPAELKANDCCCRNTDVWPTMFLAVVARETGGTGTERVEVGEVEAACSHLVEATLAECDE